MDKNNTTIALLLGGAALLVWAMQNQQQTSTNPPCSQRLVRLPDGRTVCETQLPSLGYILYNGNWYHQTQFQPSGQYSGINPNSIDWFNVLTNIVQQGGEIWTFFSGDFLNF